MISISSPNHTKSFTHEKIHIPPDTLSKGHVETIILTEIDPISDTITDYTFDKVTIEQEGDNYNLKTAQTSSTIGLFSFVSVLHEGDNPSLMDIFQDYDGKIFAYNNENFLTTKRDQLTPPFSLTYVVTWYND